MVKTRSLTIQAQILSVPFFVLFLHILYAVFPHSPVNTHGMIFALIIAIIAGIYKIIQTHYSIKKMKNELKDKNNSDTQL